jgi:hypothetical protein
MTNPLRSYQLEAPKKKPFIGEVNGLKIETLQKAIKWRGMSRLHIPGEDQECLLAETPWPPRTGDQHYVCVGSGLLFDQQSGRCLQSTHISLDLSSVAPTVCSQAQYREWREKKMRAMEDEFMNHNSVKRGPKTREQKAAIAAKESEVEDSEYATTDE